MIKMAIMKDVVAVLKLLGDNWKSYKIIKSKVKMEGSLQASLFNLEKMGFVEKESEKSLSESDWRITLEGKCFLRVVEKETQESANIRSNEVVMTIPYKFLDDLTKDCPSITSTKEAYYSLFSNAKSSIKILNPYIDASIVSFLEKIKDTVDIEIITVSGKFSKNNPLLERQKSIRKIGIKYLEEFKGGTQISQLHAKLIIVDSKVIYVGSANFKETSILHNLEAGILSTDEGLVKSYEKIFDLIYKNYAK